jgi:hypothetical protein
MEQWCCVSKLAQYLLTMQYLSEMTEDQTIAQCILVTRWDYSHRTKEA